MKRLLLAIGICALAASVVFADQRVITSGVAIRPGNNLDTLVVEGATDQVTCVDSNLNEPDGYWIGATLEIVDQSSNLADTTRTVTDWVRSTHTLTFSTFATDSIENNDSISLTFPTGDSRIKYVEGLVMVQATVDTSEIYRITPGAIITSQFLLSDAAGLDSVDTRIFLEIAINGITPNGAIEWFRIDSVTAASVSDTILYNSWGVIQANYIRFVFDPQADFDDNGFVTHYGRVMSDK